MSKHTWTGEELQQHLDAWDKRMQSGEQLNMTLNTTCVPLWRGSGYSLDCEDGHIELTLTQALIVQSWFHAHMTIQIQQPITPKPRDTQFANFANLLIQELREQCFITSHPKAFENERPFLEKLIARRAYDFASHVLENSCDEIWWNPEDIPDMTAWPKDDEHE